MIVWQVFLNSEPSLPTQPVPLLFVCVCMCVYVCATQWILLVLFTVEQVEVCLQGHVYLANAYTTQENISPSTSADESSRRSGFPLPR